MLSGWCSLREGDYPTNEEEERFLLSLFNPSEKKEPQPSCYTASEHLKMADDPPEYVKYTVSFPEFPSRGQLVGSSDPESNDETSDVPSDAVYQTNISHENSRAQKSTLLGGRRTLGCKAAKARGTLSISNSSSMDPSSVDVESSLTDGTADGEQTSMNNCEVSTQTDVFLPTDHDTGEQPEQKEAEIPAVGEDRKEVSDVGISPLVIIIKAKPPTSAECLFYPECHGEDKQDTEISPPLPVKESIISEDKDSMRVLHCVYHKANSVPCHLLGSDCDNSTAATTVTTVSPSEHQQLYKTEFDDIYKSYRENLPESHQRPSFAPRAVTSSDFNELPISEELRKLRCNQVAYSEEKVADRFIDTRFPGEPDFMDSVYNDTLYFPRFNRKNPTTDFLTTCQLSRKPKVEGIFGVEDSAATLESSEFEQYTSSQPSKETHKSVWATFEDNLSEESEKISLQGITQNIKELREKVAAERMSLQNRLRQEPEFEDLGETENGRSCFPKTMDESRDGVFGQKEVQDLEIRSSHSSTEENYPEFKATPSKKSPLQKSMTGKWHSNDDMPGKSEAVPKNKWVENLSDDEGKCGNHEDKKKRGKIRQVYKYIKDRFKGKH